MHPDVVIIGAGIIGLASALELSRQGARVVILERGSLGGECSWAGGGILASLTPWEENKSLVDLALFSNHYYAEWIDELVCETGLDTEYKRCGLLFAFDRQREKLHAWCAARGIRSELVAASAVFSKLGDTPAIWFPDVAQVRLPRLLAAVRQQLQQRGVTIREQTEVTDLDLVGDRVVSVNTTEGHVFAENFVVCAGAWSTKLLDGLAYGLDIQPVRGQILLFKAAPNFLPTILFKDHIYCIPRKDGHILVGTTLENVGFDNSITKVARRDLLKAAEQLLPGIREDHIVTQWAGLRPKSSSDLPIIDRHPSVLNLYANAGHFRYGVTMAPGAARVLASILLDLPHRIDPTPYAWPTGGLP